MNEQTQYQPQTTYYQQLGEQPLEQLEAQVAEDWRVGDVILDLYEITALLGEGGMGKVFRAHHRGWNIDLAVKCPKANIFASQQGREDYIKEAETWIELGLHPHICSCYYVRTLGDAPRLFAECVEGGSLESWIESRKLYEGGEEKALERILDIAIQFAWGLGYAHEQGLVHRDVKPHNVLMTPDGIAKVTDFGLAKAHIKSGEGVTPIGSSLVSAGGYTPAYCSPEQVEGMALDHRTDIWSWAVSVLEMFTGGVTWMSGATAAEALANFLEMGIEKDDLPALPEELTGLLQRCFEEKSALRPEDMIAIAEKLQSIYQVKTGQAYRRKLPKSVELRADSLNNKALTMLDLGNNHKALETWAQAMQIDPHHAETTYNFGMYRWQAGQQTDQELVAQLEMLRNLQPNAWLPHYLLGLAHKQRRDTISAGQAFREAARKTPGNPLIQQTLKHLDVVQSFKLLNTFEAQTASIYTLGLTSDGRQALSGSGGYANTENILRLWDLATGKCLRILEGHRAPVYAVMITPDGRRAVSGSGDRTLCVWDLANGVCLRTLEGHKYRVNALAISPDGRLALSGSGDYQAVYQERALCLWDLAKGKHLNTFEGHTGSVYSVAITPDGRKAVSGSNDNTIRIWDMMSGKCLHILKGHTSTVYALAINPDGSTVVSGSFDRMIRVWDLESGQMLRTLEGHTGPVGALAITPDGSKLISGGKDKTLRVWDLKSGKCLRTLEGHTDEVYTVVIIPNEGRIVSGGKDKTFRIWELPGDPWQTPEWVINRPSAAQDVQAADLIFRQNLQKAEMAFQNGQVRQAVAIVGQALQTQGYEREPSLLSLWHKLGQKAGRLLDLRTAQITRILRGHKGHVSSLAITQDDQTVASTGEDKTIRVWNLDSGKCEHTFNISSHRANLVITPDGSRLISGSPQDRVCVWDLKSGKCLQTFERYVQTLAINPDGRRVVSCPFNGKLLVWDLESGQILRTLEGRGNTITITPDGRRLVAGNNDYLDVWDLDNGQRLNHLSGHTSWIIALAITPNGRTVVTGSLDKTIRVWDLESGQTLRTLEGHTGPVDALAVTPDGRMIVSGSRDTTICVWNLESGRCLHTLIGQKGEISDLVITSDGRQVVSCSSDGTLMLWTLDWDYEFPEPIDWDEGAWAYLKTFLGMHPRIKKGFIQKSEPTWKEADYQQLLNELSRRGYGWLRPEGVRRKLEEMASER